MNGADYPPSGQKWHVGVGFVYRLEIPTSTIQALGSWPLGPKSIFPGLDAQLTSAFLRKD